MKRVLEGANASQMRFQAFVMGRMAREIMRRSAQALSGFQQRPFFGLDSSPLGFQFVCHGVEFTSNMRWPCLRSRYPSPKIISESFETLKMRAEWSAGAG